MIKLLSKCMLVAAVASFALAGTTTLSQAAKKKAAKPASVATCVAPKYTTTTCANNVCRMSWCGLDGQWRPSLLWCVTPFCPKA